MKKRGIYLVANFKSQELCENLIFSIRQSGCKLPIRVIHFGGKEICSDYILAEAEMLRYEDCPQQAQQLISDLSEVLTDCPKGFLYRFLPLFLDWDEYIYSDNDIVALCNWEILFDFLKDKDLVHADEEYITEGIYNYHAPQKIKEIFGERSLESAITAGHIVVKKSAAMIDDMYKAIGWFKKNPTIAKKHDQSFLHVASLLGNWQVLNLCKPPHNWLSSWSGSYSNVLNLILKTQTENLKISHIHYSGQKPIGDQPMQELLFSNVDSDQRLYKLFKIAVQKFSGIEFVAHQKKRVVGKLKAINRERS